MLNDARLSLRQYALKLGLILVFILLDLVLFPSAVQFFIPISMSFFVLWAVGLLILVYIEKVAFAKFIHPD